MSMKYRKKPVVIEAITFDELVAHGIEHGHGPVINGMSWAFSYKGHPITHENDNCYLIPTLEGAMRFERGDMLITGVKGEIYPCKADIFAATYTPEPANDNEPGAAQIGMRDRKYVDSTPHLHVGNSAFEDWYQQHPKACVGYKQLARDAYAAGMGDPLVMARDAAQQQAEPGAGERADSLEFRLRDAIKGMANCIADPMWSGHVEVSKANLKRWHKLLHDIRAAQSGQRAGAAEGWKLVPVELTDEMRQAAYDAFIAQSKKRNGLVEAYRAAVAAAPTTQQRAEPRTFMEKWSAAIKSLPMSDQQAAQQPAEPAADEWAEFETALKQYAEACHRSESCSAMDAARARVCAIFSRAAQSGQRAGAAEGWQLVPLEPTPQMLEQIKFMDNITDLAMTARYKAMLAAAPTQQQEGGS